MKDRREEEVIIKTKSPVQFLGAILAWMGEGIAACLKRLLLIAVILGPFFILHRFTVLDLCNEAHIRILGMGFQILGFLLAAWIVDRSVATLKGRTLLEPIFDYFKRVPRRTSKGVIVSVQGSAKFGAFSAQGRAGVSAGRNASVEVRLAALENSLESIQADISQIKEDVTLKTQELSTTIKDKEKKLQDKISHLENLLSDIHVTSAVWEFVAILLFVTGVILTSIPQETADALCSIIECVLRVLQSIWDTFMFAVKAPQS